MSIALITRWDNLRATKTGRIERTIWPSLFAGWQDPAPFRGQEEQPGWSPAEFSPCERARANVVRVSALCLDYDGTATLDAAQGIWEAFYGSLHTTRKHTPDANRFRVVLPFKRHVTPDEYEKLWRRVNARAGGTLDPAPKDPSRFWFEPGIPASGLYEVRQLGGALFDPDIWLAEPEPEQPRGGPVDIPRAGANDEHARRYALAGLEHETRELASTPEGQRNARLNTAAFALGQLVAAGGLTASEVWDALRQAARACGLGASETEATIASGIAAGKRQPRRIPEPTYSRKLGSYCPSPDEPTYSPPVPEPPPEPARQPGDDTAEIAAETAAPRPAVERYGFLSMLDLMQSVADELNKDRPAMGARTGHSDLDEAMGGFRKGNISIFGAKRGFGKTSFGNLVTDLAIPGLNVAMFAGEDAAAMYGKRFLAARAGVNAMLLRDYKCNRDDWPRITAALVAAPRNPFFVRVDGRPVEWIAQAIRDVAKEQRIDLVIVDYLQCLRTSRKLQDRRNEVTHVARTLTDAIKGVDAAGLLFSQLKRTERTEPDVEDLKESGDIEDMAEHIILGWKVEVPNGQAERWVKLGKNKDGVDASEVAAIQMRWDNKTASFQQTTTGEPACGDDAFGDFDARYGGQ